MKNTRESLKAQQANFRMSPGPENYPSVKGGLLSTFCLKILKSGFSLLCLSILLSSILINSQTGFAQPAKVFRAGAATSNITPKIGTSINGNMKDVMVRQIHDETHARCIVIDDGKTKLAMLTVDLCMIYREELDAAKQQGS
jgi:hypothetical protein